jgi:hypothetical protein
MRDMPVTSALWITITSRYSVRILARPGRNSGTHSGLLSGVLLFAGGSALGVVVRHVRHRVMGVVGAAEQVAAGAHLHAVQVRGQLRVGHERVRRGPGLHVSPPVSTVTMTGPM